LERERERESGERERERRERERDHKTRTREISRRGRKMLNKIVSACLYSLSVY